MSKKLKELVAGELTRRYGSMDAALLINVHGLSGVEANTFRAHLRKAGADVHVIKNNIATRVFANTPLAPLTTALTGPCALVTGGTSTVDIAKELLRLSKDYPKLELRVGVLDGEKECASIESISKRRSKAEIQGEVVMLFTSPGRRVVGCLNTGGKIAGCIKAIVDKLEKGETITKVA